MIRILQLRCRLCVRYRLEWAVAKGSLPAVETTDRRPRRIDSHSDWSTATIRMTSLNNVFDLINNGVMNIVLFVFMAIGQRVLSHVL